MQIVQYDELGKLKELEHGLTLSTPDDGIVACWVSRAHNNRVHGGALDGRKFWDVGELCEKLSIGFSRVEVPSTGVQMYSGMKDANSRSVVKPHATRGERFAMPYVRRPDVEYSHAVNDLARRMLHALSAELPWVKLVLPQGVYSVCDRALVTINFASALHRDGRDKVSGESQLEIDDLLEQLRAQPHRNQLEEPVLLHHSMLSPAASAPTGCAWQLRAPKGWEIFTAFIYAKGYVRIVNKCAQVSAPVFACSQYLL